MDILEANISETARRLGSPFSYLVRDRQNTGPRQVVIVHDRVFSGSTPLSLSRARATQGFFFSNSGETIAIPLFADGENWRNRLRSSLRPAFLIEEVEEGVFRTTAFSERITDDAGQRRFGLSKFAPRSDMVGCFQQLAHWAADVTGGSRGCKRKLKGILEELGAPPSRGQRLLSKMTFGVFGRS